MGADEIKERGAREIPNADKVGRPESALKGASEGSRPGKAGVPLNRRSFLQAAGGLSAVIPAAAPGEGGNKKAKPVTSSGAGDNRIGKAPFKVLFSNDATNIIENISPYRKGEPYDFDVLWTGDLDKRVGPMTDAMVRASVDEIVGADAQFIQPGYGWIAWWKSSAHPAADDYHYMQAQTGVPPDAFGRYVLSGGDMVQVFVDRCRQRGQAPFVSLRLNDPQLLDYGKNNPHSVFVSRFYMEHPEYRLGTDMKDNNQRGQNWAIPEVREYKLSLIRELCENYDIAGFELDFMRHPRFFNLGETTVDQRTQIMTEFVGRVRRLLDETERGGRHRWLCARVPCYLVAYETLGLDLPDMVAAGLEMVNVSASFFTTQRTDLPIIRKMVPSAAVYLEMAHTTWRGPSVPGSFDSYRYLRTTDQQFYTGAELAYARGADGVSLFNFLYYREHGHDRANRGPFSEPPLHIIPHLGDPTWLHTQRQWYLLSKGWSDPHLLGEPPLPKTFHSGDQHAFLLDLAPNRQNQGLLRLRSLVDASGRTWTVRLNGTKLQPADYVAKPIDQPYDAYLGEANQYACFAVPPGTTRDGNNELLIVLNQGDSLSIEYLDLTF